MKHTHAITILLFTAALGLSGCATPEQPASERLSLTRDAAAMINEEGQAMAAMAGSRESRSAKADLVCERIKRTGSHLTELYCYTRAEKIANEAKLRAELQHIRDGGFRALEEGRKFGPFK